MCKTVIPIMKFYKKVNSTQYIKNNVFLIFPFGRYLILQPREKLFWGI